MTPTLTVAVLAFAQYAHVEIPPERLGTPLVKAEPRRAIPAAPNVLYQNLFDPAKRNAALNALLGEEFKQPQGGPMPDVQLRTLQLDEDEDPEFTLVLHRAPVTFVCVYDRSGGAWYDAGLFLYGWHWNRADAERVLQVDAPFIVIRGRAGGTGVSSTTARVYRLWHGRLYRTLEVEEERWAYVHGGERTESREARLTLEPDTAVWRGADITTFDAPGKPPIRRPFCRAFQWSPSVFAHTESAAARKEVRP